MWFDLCSHDHKVLLFVEVILCLSHGSAAVEMSLGQPKSALWKTLRKYVWWHWKWYMTGRPQQVTQVQYYKQAGANGLWCQHAMEFLPSSRGFPPSGKKFFRVFFVLFMHLSYFAVIVFMCCTLVKEARLSNLVMGRKPNLNSKIKKSWES